MIYYMWGGGGYYILLKIWFIRLDFIRWMRALGWFLRWYIKKNNRFFSWKTIFFCLWLSFPTPGFFFFFTFLCCIYFVYVQPVIGLHLGSNSGEDSLVYYIVQLIEDCTAYILNWWIGLLELYIGFFFKDFVWMIRNKLNIIFLLIVVEKLYF